MYRVPPDRAWWPAVGAPLERGVRPHSRCAADWSVILFGRCRASPSRLTAEQGRYSSAAVTATTQRLAMRGEVSTDGMNSSRSPSGLRGFATSCWRFRRMLHCVTSVEGGHSVFGTQMQPVSSDFGLCPPSTMAPAVPVGAAMNSFACSRQVRSHERARLSEDWRTNANSPMPAARNAMATRRAWERGMW